MYSNIKFYEKGNEQYKIHFPVRLGDLKEVSIPGENSNTSDFNEIKIMLLMFTGSQDLSLEVFIDLIIGYKEKCWITYVKYKLIFINHYISEF